MGEEEFVLLNDLLTKYKVACYKEYALDPKDTKYRQKMISQIRAIDNIRKNMFLVFDEVSEEGEKNEC